MRIGIVGAENSHTVAIAKTLNIEKKIEGAQVVCVWGETRKFAQAAAEAGQIPTIVKEPEDMIGQVDAAIVDHRHGKHHLPAAKPLLEAKLPLFIDKPFCYRTAEGKRFLTRAGELDVPVCSFSVLPKQTSFVAAQDAIQELGRILAVVSTGPCDLRSKYGGVFFYGIHPMELMVAVMGKRVKSVRNVGAKGAAVVRVTFTDGRMGVLTVYERGLAYTLEITLHGSKGHLRLPINDHQGFYSNMMGAFLDMVETGKPPIPYDQTLNIIRSLELAKRSLRTRREYAV